MTTDYMCMFGSRPEQFSSERYQCHYVTSEKNVDFSTLLSTGDAAFFAPVIHMAFRTMIVPKVSLSVV